MNEWINCKDNLPDKNKNVLVYGNNDYYVASYNYDISNIKNTDEIVWDYSYCCGCHATGITHWMPLSEKSE